MVALQIEWVVKTRKEEFDSRVDVLRGKVWIVKKTEGLCDDPQHSMPATLDATQHLMLIAEAGKIAHLVTRKSCVRLFNPTPLRYFLSLSLCLCS